MYNLYNLSYLRTLYLNSLLTNKLLDTYNFCFSNSWIYIDTYFVTVMYKNILILSTNIVILCKAQGTEFWFIPLGLKHLLVPMNRFV
jgi:hypothetical protein